MFAKFFKPVAVCVCILAASAPALADPCRGKLSDVTTVNANTTKVYTEKFWGNETTRIRLSGDGDTCLELRVYDENGKLVASDTAGWGDDRQVFVRPTATGKFRVEVKNLGDVYNKYVIIMD